VEVHGPRVEEDDLDVEDDEEHRRQVVLDGEPAAAGRLRGRLDAAFVGLQFRPVVPLGAGDAADDHRYDDERGAVRAEYEYGRVQLHRGSFPFIAWRDRGARRGAPPGRTRGL